LKYYGIPCYIKYTAYNLRFCVMAGWWSKRPKHVAIKIRKTKNKYRGVDKSLARTGRKQARKHVRDVRDFNKIEKRAVIKFLFLQGKAPKEIHAILTETLTCFLPGRAKDLLALLDLGLLLCSTTAINNLLIL